MAGRHGEAKTMRTLLCLATVLALLAAAPVALAQQASDNSTRPDDAAWVEDCPPDMLCAAGAPEEGNATAEPTRGPADGSCENCRGDANETPILYGSDGCIECSGPAPTGGDTCMDGASPAEQCDPDVQYLGGSPPATDSSHAPVVESDGGDEKAVPAPAVAVLIVGAGVAMVLLGRRR